jgi:hypothetical protein
MQYADHARAALRVKTQTAHTTHGCSIAVSPGQTTAGGSYPGRERARALTSHLLFDDPADASQRPESRGNRPRLESESSFPPLR